MANRFRRYSGDRCALLASVLAPWSDTRFVVRASWTRARIAWMRFGVVVTKIWGWAPRRVPMRTWSQAVAPELSGRWLSAAISSTHVQCDCGPRSWDGSSLEKVRAWEPLGQSSRLSDGVYSGMKSGGEIARMPDSPWIMTSRTSETVRPTRCPIEPGSDLAFSFDQEPPVRVLPEPRPARMPTIGAGSWSASNWSGRSQSSGASRSSSVEIGQHPFPLGVGQQRDAVHHRQGGLVDEDGGHGTGSCTPNVVNATPPVIM